MTGFISEGCLAEFVETVEIRADYNFGEAQLGIAIGGAPNPFSAALLVGEIVGLVVALVLLCQVKMKNGPCPPV
jgi:hypothetical protein